ncbi:hypothetical protein PR048_028045, partial [Dryococelus australis]
MRVIEVSMERRWNEGTGGNLVSIPLAITLQKLSSVLLGPTLDNTGAMTLCLILLLYPIVFRAYESIFGTRRVVTAYLARAPYTAFSLRSKLAGNEGSGSSACIALKRVLRACGSSRAAVVVAGQTKFPCSRTQALLAGERRENRYLAYQGGRRQGLASFKGPLPEELVGVLPRSRGEGDKKLLRRTRIHSNHAHSRQKGSDFTSMPQPIRSDAGSSIYSTVEFSPYIDVERPTQTSIIQIYTRTSKLKKQHLHYTTPTQNNITLTPIQHRHKHQTHDGHLTTTVGPSVSERMVGREFKVCLRTHAEMKPPRCSLAYRSTPSDSTLSLRRLHHSESRVGFPHPAARETGRQSLHNLERKCAQAEIRDGRSPSRRPGFARPVPVRATGCPRLTRTGIALCLVRFTSSDVGSCWTPVAGLRRPTSRHAPVRHCSHALGNAHSRSFRYRQQHIPLATKLGKNRPPIAKSREFKLELITREISVVNRL